MVGYWPSYFLTKSRSIKRKKGRGKYSAILTEQAWSITDLSHDQTNNFFLRDQRGVLQGSLSNDDGDGNENNKIAIGLYQQNNISARASRSFVHFFAIVARLQRESASFHVLSRTETHDNNFLILFLNFDIQLPKSCQHLHVFQLLCKMQNPLT